MKPIEKYGIRLVPMQSGDLERVRRWRNAPHVRRTMAFREHITPVQQVAWWRGLDPFRNFYYLVEYKGQSIGVVHAKDIDWEAGTAETGIFLGKKAYLDGFVPVLAVLALMDELFEVHQLRMLRAKVKADNPKILDFNRRLGYVRESESNGFLRLAVSREGYFEQAKGLREMAARLAEG